ncbi:MAG: thrombospondin type 3 repeat-containing protein [candidate division Zixibacteria bacterium]
MSKSKSLSIMIICLLSLIMSGSLQAQEYTCGDANNDGIINIKDIVAVLDYLLNKSGLPANPEAADVDQIPGITMNDNQAIVDAFVYKFDLTCQTVPDTTIEVTDDSIFVLGGLVLPGVRDIEVEVKVKTNEHIYGISLPFAFSCATSEVVCDSVTFPPRFYYSFEIQQSVIDNSAHTVLTALGSIAPGGLTGPGEFQIASLWLHVESVNETEEQEIVFDTTQVPPNNYVLLTKNQPNHEAAIPGIKYISDIVLNQDSDDDGIYDAYDNCPFVPNPDQANDDGDSYGNLCDNCPSTPSEDLTDSDGDELGDVCDACPNDADNDIDGDSVCGDIDNCPTVANADQADLNGNNIGDACESTGEFQCGDVNGDGWVNVGDPVYLINFLFKYGPPPCQPIQKK